MMRKFNRLCNTIYLLQAIVIVARNLSVIASKKFPNQTDCCCNLNSRVCEINVSYKYIEKGNSMFWKVDQKKMYKFLETGTIPKSFVQISSGVDYGVCLRTRDICRTGLTLEIVSLTISSHWGGSIGYPLDKIISHGELATSSVYTQYIFLRQWHASQDKACFSTSTFTKRVDQYSEARLQS